MAAEAARAVKGASWLLEQPEPQDAFTPEDLSEQQRLIAQTARDFVEKRVWPAREAIENQDFATHARLMREAGELGLLGAEIPEEYGGLMLDKISAALITERVAAAGGWALTHGAHVGIGTLPIVFFGTPDQKRRYLPRLAAGEWIAAYALTESGSGSDALGARATARLSSDGRHYVLNGTKQWITNAGLAQVFTVFAKIDGERFSAFIVERGFPGVSTGKEERKMGIKGSSTRSLILQDVPVPIENLLGEPGKGHLIAFNILNLGRYKLGAACGAGCRRLLGVAAEYANERRQFGRPIGSFRLIQQKLADMAVRTYALESVVYRTGGMLDAALRTLGADANDPQLAARTIGDYAVECAINKVLGSEALDFVADEALQIHGGYGYMQEYEVERAYRDSRINRIFEGTNEINRLLMVDSIVKKAMRGELGLMQAAAALPAELAALAQGGPPAAGDGPAAAELGMARVMKKILLLTAGLAVQKHGAALEEEQEVVAACADMAIEIFASESALLRAAKSQEREPGSERAAHHLDLARVYAREALDRVAALARLHLPALLDGEALTAQLKLLHRITLYPPADLIGLKRRIAARALAANGPAW